MSFLFFLLREGKRKFVISAHLTLKECSIIFFPCFNSSYCFYIHIQVQRALQLRIEEHARYLQKILDEQHKAGIALISPQTLSSLTNPCEDPELRLSSPSAGASPPHPAESKTDSSTSLPSKNKASDSSDLKPQQCSKRPRPEEKQESGSEKTAVGDAVQ